MPDYHLLGLGNLLSVLTQVEIKQWGNELLISCLLDPLNTRQPYQLIFSGVKEIRWYIHDANEIEVIPVDLIGFIIGEPGNSKPCIITTNSFEIFVLYNVLSVQIGPHVRRL